MFSRAFCQRSPGRPEVLTLYPIRPHARKRCGQTERIGGAPWVGTEFAAPSKDAFADRCTPLRRQDGDYLAFRAAGRIIQLMARSNRQMQSAPLAAAVLVWLHLSAPANVAAVADVQRHRLENGLWVLLYPSEATDQVAIAVLYAIGEDHDPPQKCGLTHLTEHLYVTAAAGDVPARSAEELMRRYPNAWNAQTGTDYTVFATVVHKSQLEGELREAAARMGKLRLTEADLDREKPRVLQEVRNMYGGFPPLAAINHARRRVRPSIVGHRKGGLPEHVQRITVDDVKGWWSRHYKPTNATLVLAGAFNPDDTRERVAKHFGPIPAGEKPPEARKPGQPKPTKMETVTVEPSSRSAQGHACIALSAPDPGSKHYAACLLLVSRMWMRAMSSGGSPQVIFSVLDDPTFIAVSASVGPHDTPEQALEALRSFVEEATTAPLQQFEKLAVKNNLGVMLGVVDFPGVMLKQNLYGVAFSIGRRAQLGLDSTKLAGKLDRLTNDDLKAARHALFAPERQVAIVVMSRP